MTITQAKSLRLGQRVTNIKTGQQGTVIGMYHKINVGPCIHIQWDRMGTHMHHVTAMNSIHIIAN